LLGIGRDAAYAAAKTGAIPTIRLGRRLVVPLAALRRMVEAAGEPTGAEGPAVRLVAGGKASRI
jgi:hypothetical protein